MHPDIIPVICLAKLEKLDLFSKILPFRMNVTFDGSVCVVIGYVGNGEPH